MLEQYVEKAPHGPHMKSWVAELGREGGSKRRCPGVAEPVDDMEASFVLILGVDECGERLDKRARGILEDQSNELRVRWLD